MLLRAMVCLAIVGCGGGTTPDRPRTFGGDRPVSLQVPAMFDESKQYPLVLVLHGYGANGFVQEAFFGMNKLAADNTAFVMAPDGLVDSTGKQFWNADPACCDFDHTNPDDSAYLGGLLDDVIAAWPIDKNAVYVVGHSNGGYMAYRMACDHADVITNIVVLAGAASTLACAPAKPVNVLHLHGTADAMVPYSEAMPSVTKWLGYDNCTGSLVQTGTIDLEASLPGAETMQQKAACPQLADVELWTITGGAHVPNFNATFEPTIWQWLTGNRRP